MSYNIEIQYEIQYDDDDEIQYDDDDKIQYDDDDEIYDEIQ